MKKIAIVYVTYDGILNTMCGVGIISRNFIECFDDVRRIFLKKDIDLSLHLITPALNSTALGFSKEIGDRSKALAVQTGGDLHLVINGTDGSEQFGDTDNWIVASATAANKSLEIAKFYDETFVFCVDPPFFHMPRYIHLQKNAFGEPNITSVLVPHSDVLSHHAEDPDIKRLEWEALAFKYCQGKKDIKIAKTSKFLMEHLIRHYNFQSTDIVDLQTGLDIQNKRYEVLSKDLVKESLKKYGIPLDKDLIFSVARAVPYKGFEALIEAFSKIKSKNTHLVFIASPYKFAPSNVSVLKELIGKYKINCTPIYQLDMELPSKICQWDRTKIVAQLSLHEPFGLVPEEVRMWTREKGPVVLTSNREGFLEQLDDGTDGFFVDPTSPYAVAKKIDYILTMPEKKIGIVRRAGYKRVLKNYNYRIAMSECLMQLITKDQKIKPLGEEIKYENLL